MALREKAYKASGSKDDLLKRTTCFWFTGFLSSDSPDSGANHAEINLNQFSCRERSTTLRLLPSTFDPDLIQAGSILRRLFDELNQFSPNN
eukprot:644335-Pelagomonas_calceolata.AAC.4